MKLRQGLKSLLSAEYAILLAIITASTFLLTFRLIKLVPNFAAAEQPLPSVNDSLSLIWHQPLELPAILSRLVVAGLSPTTNIGLARLPNALLALSLILMMYWLLRRWYNYRLALFGALLLMTAPWLLHVGRLATNGIVYPLAMATALVLAALWHQQQRSRWLIYGSILAAAFLLYIPGAIWLIVWGAIVERRNLWNSIKAARWHTVFAAILAAGVLTPLGHALYLNWHLYRPLLGLPESWPSLLHVGEQFLLTWKYIFIGGYVDPLYNLANVALENFLIIIGFAVGLYLYGLHPKAVRTRQLAGFWLIGTLLIALGGPVAIQLILPIVLVLALGGIGYLLHLWLRVFPRNPLARWFGIGLVGLMIIFAVAYNVRNYYFAWPNTAETRAVFKQ